MPNLDDDFIAMVSDRYIELFEQITGTSFDKSDISNINSRIETNMATALDNILVT